MTDWKILSQYLAGSSFESEEELLCVLLSLSVFEALFDLSVHISQIKLWEVTLLASHWLNGRD